MGLIYLPLVLLLAIGLLVAVLGTPIWLLATGIMRIADKRGGVVRTAIGAVWLVAVMAVGIWVADGFSARHEKILDKGVTPDGREYCLLQRRGGEPYEVRLYVRNAKREWVGHYVDHEVWPWRSGRLDFTNGTARVLHGDRPHCTVDIEPPDAPGRPNADFTPSATPETILGGSAERL